MKQNEQTVDAIIARSWGVKQDETRTPILPETERRAYQAAWRIDREPVPETLNQLSCPSTRHARYIDHTARIIAEEMGAVVFF